MAQKRAFNEGHRHFRKNKKQKTATISDGSNEDVLLKDIRSLLEELKVQQSEKEAPAIELGETEVRISKISSTGDGLGEKNGQIYVVPFTAIGDLVKVKVYKHFPNEAYALTDYVELIEPSKLRQGTPKCPYFTKCSGCQFQHLPYEFQLSHKQMTVSKAFHNFSGLTPEQMPIVGQTMASPLQYGYRTKLTPHFDGPPSGRKDRRNGQRVTWEAVPEIGFMRKGTRKTLDIEDCPIGTDAVRAGMKTERERVAANINDYQRGATLLLRESTDRTERDGVKTEVKTCITNHNATSTEYIDDFRLDNPAGSFFQNNNSILPVVTQYLRDNILRAPTTSDEDTEKPPITHMIDAYCGSGFFTITLSGMFKNSIGIDIASQSIDYATKNAKLNNLPESSVQFIAGDANALFASVDNEKFPADETAVVIDPPRKGCDEGFIKQLMDYGPARICYISCNVHTQARDVGWLVGGLHERPGMYELESLRGFDFFPQTNHVEGVAILNRAASYSLLVIFVAGMPKTSTRCCGKQLVVHVRPLKMSYNQRGRGGRGGGQQYDRRDRYDQDSRGQSSQYRDDRRSDYGDRSYDQRRGQSNRGGYDQRGQSDMPYRSGRGGYGDGSRGNRGGFRGRGGGGSEQRGGIYLAQQAVPAPDPAVRQLEDQLVTQTRDKSFGVDGQMMPGRPGYGKAGRDVVLRANYLQIKAYTSSSGEAIVLYKYEIDIKPEQASRAQKQSMVKTVLRLLSAEGGSLSGIMHATDYTHILLTTKKLDDSAHDLLQKGVSLSDGTPQSTAPGQAETTATTSRKTFDYRITFANSYSVDQLLQFLKSQSPGVVFNHSKDVIQLLNIIVLKSAHDQDNLLVTTQNKAFPYTGHPGMEHCELGGGLVALRGYFSSIRPAIGRLLLNVNVCSGAFYKGVKVTDLLRDMRGRANEIEAFIRRLKVRVVYKKSEKDENPVIRYRTIWSLATGNAFEVTFNYQDRQIPDKPTQRMTVYDYYKDIVGIVLKEPKLQLLNVGNRENPSYIPQELCTIKDGQQYRKLLSGDQTTAMLGFSARPPNVNAVSIAGDQQQAARGLRLLRLTDPAIANVQDQSVHPFGIHADTDLITVPARVLNASQIRYGRGNATPNNGAWNCAKQEFFKPASFGNWTVLNLDQRDYEQDVKVLENYMRDYGLRFPQRMQTFHKKDLRPLNMDNRQANEHVLNDAFRQLESRNIRFVLVIIRDYDKWLHACVKSLAETKYGIITQCTVASKFSKQQGQGMYMANLALKINMKFGGMNHTVAGLLSGRLDANTMLVGIDVTHPSPGSAKNAPSIACVVASIDGDCAQWPGSIRCQRSRQEMVANTMDTTGADMVSDLAQMILERLELWRKKNGSLPTKIVVFRDGVSEAQYSLVLSMELPSFHEAFKKVYGAEDKWPKMAIIIVGKRHHTRFYPTQERDADCGKRPNYNPLPGTIVDRGIVDRLLGDFFLQAHQGLQGTARPAHYIVIKDDIKFEADELQGFTHKLCYMFGRATKAVSVVPPVYYADLLAERAREYLFSTMAEGSLGSSRSGNTPEWDGKLHPRIGETTWYT